MTKAIILIIEETIDSSSNQSREPDMDRHRFRELLTRSEPLPSAQAPLPASGFMACPLSPVLGGPCRAVQEELYRRAWEEARAVLRPSILERCAAHLAN